MQRKSARAGGCFLTLFIPLGFLAGLAFRDPLGGSVIGLAVGAAIAVSVWLVDRRRNRHLDDSTP